MRLAQERRVRWFVCAAVITVACLAYMRIPHADFVQWDDGEFVTENERIQRLTPETIVDIFRVKPRLGPQSSGQYLPLTLLSFAVEHRLFGLDPRFFHVTNAVLNALNAGLVFWLVVLLVGGNAGGFGVSSQTNDQCHGRSATFIAAVTALFFAVHPLHVESVAWVSQRKDVLSAFFYFLALLLYELGYGKQEKGWPVLVSVCGLCALLSKPTAVTLPLALVLQDYVMGRRIVARNLVNKIPLFVMAVCIGAVNSYTQRMVGALSPYRVADWRYNVLLAAKGVVFYIEKALFPANLSAVYPAPKLIGYFDPDTMMAVGFTAVLIAVAVLMRRRMRMVTYCIALFLVTLAPMAQLLPTGLAIAAADRFFYLPSLGFFLLLGWLLNVVRRAGSGRVAYVIVCGVAAVWMALTIERSGVWLDSFRLWADTARKTPNSDTVLNNFGLVLAHRGRVQESRLMFERSLAVATNSYALINLGMWHLRQGNTNTAREYLATGEALDPKQFELRYARAAFEFGQTNYALAEQYLTQLADERPLAVHLRVRLAAVYMMLAQTNKAVAVLHDVINDKRQGAGVFLELGQLYEQTSELSLADEVYRQGLERFPSDANLLYRRGVTLSRMGRHREAIGPFTQHLEVQPRNWDAWSNIALAYKNAGEYERAVEFSRTALAGARTSPEISYNHACVLVAAGKTDEALDILTNLLARVPGLRQSAVRDDDLQPLWLKIRTAP